MSLPFFLAGRLPLNSSSTDGNRHGGNHGIVVAIGGIALSIVVMIVSISVMMGFRKAIRDKVIGFESQLVIGTKNTDNSSDISPLISRSDVEPILDVLPDDITLSLTVKQPAILKTPDNFTGAIFKGVDSTYDWNFISQSLIDGVIPDYRADSTLYHVVVSRSLAGMLDLSLGDRVDSYFLGTGAYKARRLKIAGIFDTHFSEYDRNMIFGSLSMLQRMIDVPDSCATIVEINGLRTDEAIDAAEDAVNAAYLDMLFAGKTDRHYTVLSIHKTAAVFFNWLELLDTNVKVILVLMSLLTALTLISSLFILILRRVGMIGILKALGASNKMVRTTFVILTCRILAWGLLIGNILGIGLAYIQSAFHLIPMDPDAYYLDHVPVLIDWEAIVVLNIAVVVMALAVLLLPSAIIATISPSRSIRYE